MFGYKSWTEREIERIARSRTRTRSQKEREIRNALEAERDYLERLNKGSYGTTIKGKETPKVWKAIKVIIYVALIIAAMVFVYRCMQSAY